PRWARYSRTGTAADSTSAHSTSPSTAARVVSALRDEVSVGARTTERRAAARRSAARTPAVPATRSGMTTRAAVLGLVLCALVLSAAVPLREYLAQRGEISRAQEAQAQQRERVAALEARKQELEDPAYVRRVARERLHYVMPGETSYVVLRPEAPTPEEAARKGPAGAKSAQAPWFSQLWGSVQAADAGR
ncbi:MAG: septum formation inhibitor, partial [Frankiales bacterium]|nr:septum formation inhibitor [Frankiales bacterium]